jgi:hypothetical protein
MLYPLSYGGGTSASDPREHPRQQGCYRLRATRHLTRQRTLENKDPRTCPATGWDARLEGRKEFSRLLRDARCGRSQRMVADVIRALSTWLIDF